MAGDINSTPTLNRGESSPLSPLRFPSVKLTEGKRKRIDSHTLVWIYTTEQKQTDRGNTAKARAVIQC